MDQSFLDNSLWRNIYCLLAGDSAGCSARDYASGLLPGGMEWLAFAITALAIIGLVINGVLGGVIVLIWGERRLFGRFQSRTGPNRWGPFGMLTSVADAIKTMFKEDVVPVDADRILFNLAPILIATPALLVFAVIPFGIGTYVADLNVGVLFIMAVTSLTTLSVLTAAWSSANRIAILSALRSVALLISYEIPMALALVGVIMLAGSLSLGQIVQAQGIPFILVQPLAFFVFFIAAMAEMARAPFDLTEAESELAAGYLNDYASMKFGLFFLAEFMAEISTAAIVTTLFLSGWKGWEPIPSHFWFMAKLILVLFVIIWFRMTLPRLRIDQVLKFAWKGLFELTLINIVVTAILIGIWPQPTTAQLWMMAAVNWPVAIISIWLVSRLLGTAKYEKASPDSDSPVYSVATESIPKTSEYITNSTDVSSVEAVSKEGGA
ncbi:MAG: NADH-quinone oxidoreductase subunit NuoH [SAR202 cluster bacterium]|jgi:NADH-quinone oxidoreductase subunit H|nr:MAG: NADH-quinone oxidoreductase subunit NuoH [SAR202 cluster bacterium]KAA1300749.1 MAG: NADH-quinone oxidoreductase subunit NuoH [SAR202 cluster bacterium]KAA1301915.1 MAG: NADH-quinone oxidoreductase subunit NuoH [SAR202 cluster bacterium]MCH2529944.1 NADH-quinone oxidoreductase subunit NuoH [Dehalococcoidia bacterium]MQG89806.1 NADH-quinone oxidoreductase subunit NuoH [SAR202 cluster bacterium]|tara:strand:- start:2951 stop:4261 length:1311 start_codon:yes stop_codon:yes gene_type:complete